MGHRSDGVWVPQWGMRVPVLRAAAQPSHGEAVVAGPEGARRAVGAYDDRSRQAGSNEAGGQAASASGELPHHPTINYSRKADYSRSLVPPALPVNAARYLPPMQSISAWLAWTALTACAHPGTTASPTGKTSGWAEIIPDRVATEWATSGPLRERISHAPADLVLFHIAEQRGSLDTCGCPRRPRGSLGRFAGWVEAARGASPAPEVVLNTGYWLVDAVDYAGQTRPDAEEMNTWMAHGLDLAGFDAINVSGHDMLGLASLDPTIPLPLVSAQISGPGVAKWVVVERAGVRVGVTGVTAEVATMAAPGPYKMAPISEVAPVLRELATVADVVVLLAWNVEAELPTLLKSASGVDIVVQSGLFTEGPQGKSAYGAVWTTSVFQGVQAGELRLDLDGGEVIGALDRRVDLDDMVPPRRDVDLLMVDAKRAIDAIQRAAYGE